VLTISLAKSNAVIWEPLIMKSGSRDHDIEAKTRSFVAKAITVVGLTLLFVAGLYAALSGNEGELRTTMVSMTQLMSFVFGYYLARGRHD
jgi:hypothetical protein